MARADHWLAGGRVGRPHGLDGSFHVVDARPELLALGVYVRAGERVAEIVRRAGTDDRPILRLAGVETRDAADALRGTELHVERDVAPALEEDEWWAEDLEGCRVVDGDRELGRVARLVPLPSCEALEVTGGGEDFLVPLVRDAVRAVDVQAKVIDVDVAFLGDTAPESARAPMGATAPASTGDGESTTPGAAPAKSSAGEAPANPETGDASTASAGTPANPETGHASAPPAGTPANPETGDASAPSAGTPANPDTGDASAPSAGTPATSSARRAR